jgi:WD40 repeat protein
LPLDSHFSFVGHKINMTMGSPVSSVTFSPGGSLVTGDFLGNVDFWNTSNGQPIASLPEADGGVASLAFPYPVSFLPSAAEMAT